MTEPTRDQLAAEYASGGERLVSDYPILEEGFLAGWDAAVAQLARPDITEAVGMCLEDGPRTATGILAEVVRVLTQETEEKSLGVRPE